MINRALHSRMQVLCFLLFASLCFPYNSMQEVKAQKHISVPHSFRIFYPVNDTVVRENYMDNPIQLDYIRRCLILSPQVDSVVIHAYASPEGSFSLNKKLAQARARSAKRYLLQCMPVNRQLPDSMIVLKPVSENWQGLRQLIVEEYPNSDKTALLEILDNRAIDDEERKRRLKQLNGGMPWRYISMHLLPQLRYSTWLSVSYPIADVDGIPELAYPAIGAPLPLTLPNVQFLPVHRETANTQKTILALKTNLLYDLVTWVNYSVEVPIGKRFSTLLYHQFPWWRWGKGNNQYCMRFLSLGAEGRWWFNPNPHPQKERFIQRDKLMGHFLGVYAESGKWDFEWGRKICHQGEHWSAGISYGYSMPLGRRLNMELSLSAGYASIPYRKFEPSVDYEILWRDPVKHGRWHYFGPTKAQISLVLPVLVKARKGGMQ